MKNGLVNSLQISKIKEEERDQLIDLLSEANLPVSDLPQSLNYFYLAKKDEKTIGSIGLEDFGSCALLRSMVVTKGMQGEGVGKKLLNHLIATLKEDQGSLKEIYLITEHAEKFFQATGFETIARDDVAETISELPQFKSICPTSAAVMKMKI